MAQTIFDNSTGKYKDIDIMYHENRFWITGYHFTKTALKGSIRIFTKYHENKRVNVSLYTVKGKNLINNNDFKNHISAEHVKHITIEEYELFILVKIYI